ncbi:MAG: hypothetical protein M3N53_08015 [Actinomycetota bacterium]|nr:hypothetical protein [Actinomycetota bacterium]
MSACRSGVTQKVHPTSAPRRRVSRPRARVAAALVIAMIGAAFASDPRRPDATFPPLRAPRGATITNLLAADHSFELDERAARIPATVKPFTGAQVETESYPTFDARGRRIGRTRWRIIEGTGNCCENFLATTPEGLLLDFGGTTLKFSSDEGQNWNVVEPRPALPVPSSFGEGAVLAAPGGDIVGVTWIIIGDVLLSFKFEADEQQWIYSSMPVHQPVYDRPEIAVIPGPFTIAGSRVDYISIVRGGPAGFKSPWLYSTDGVTYAPGGDKFLEQVVQPPVQKWLDLRPTPLLDWIQPHEDTGMTALGDGSAIAGRARIPDFTDAAGPQFAILSPQTLRWSAFEFPRGSLPQSQQRFGDMTLPSDGHLRADSRGRLHYVFYGSSSFEYFLTSDGGRSWTSKVIQLPAGYTLAGRDFYTSFKTNGALAMSAVAVHARDTRTKKHQDFVFRFDVADDRIRLANVYAVGAGNMESSAGSRVSGARFDFANVAFLPDGRLVTSFADETHRPPAIAVELPQKAR